MGNKSQHGVFIQLEKSFYLPGDLVQGRICINTAKPLPCERICLHVLGVEKSWFRKGTGKNLENGSVSSMESLQSLQKGQRKDVKMKPKTGQFFGENKIIEAYFNLVAWNKDSYLQGQYVFPFVFQLPQYIPGSYLQENANFKASILYQIRVICLSPKSKSPPLQSQIQMIIREPQRNKQESMFGEIFVYPISCGCRKHGISRICCYFEKNQYVPGQDCIVICEADNYKCSLGIKEIKVQFYKQVVLTSSTGEKNVYLQEIQSESFPGVGVHQMYTGENAKKIHLPLRYTDSKSVIHSSTQGRLVQCSYFLQVTPIFSGFFTQNSNYFRITLRVLQQGIIQPQVEQPDNWNPEYFSKSQIFFNSGNLQNENLTKMNEY